MLDIRAWKIRAAVDSVGSISKIERRLVTVDYGIADLAPGLDRVKIDATVRSNYKDSSEKRIAAHVGQLFTLLNRIAPNDLLVIPVNKGKDILLGKVSRAAQVQGTCIEIEAASPILSFPINSFAIDLRYSFMAIMKVCEVSRNDAASRLNRAFVRYQDGTGVDLI